MKSCKKIISVLLIVILIAVQIVPILNVKAEGSTITTYGENEDGINPNLVTNTATLTVNGYLIEGIQNKDELTAYKIIDVFYNEQTNEMTYDYTSDFRNFLDQHADYGQTFTIEKYFQLTSDKPEENSNPSLETTSTLNVLVSKYATYIRKNNIQSTYDMTTINGNATAQVVAGAYLILPRQISNILVHGENDLLGIARFLYGTLVGNVVFSENNGEFVLNDVNLFAKNADSSFVTGIVDRSLEDYMKDSDCEISGTTSSHIGERRALMNVIEFPESFPTNAINKMFKLEFEMDDGINYDSSSVLLLTTDTWQISNNKLIDHTGIEMGTIQFEAKKITITIDLEAYAGKNLYSGNYMLQLFYDIYLNENAIVGTEGNKIMTSLTVTDDPYVENSYVTYKNATIIYTYGLELTNLSKADSTLLKGAKYEIYSKYTDSVLSNKIGEFTVGDDGKASFEGVPSGTIYLKQVKAPVGYQIIKDPIAVEIATEDAIAGTQEGYYQVIVRNDAMWYLPSTGGIGTILYTLIGLTTIILSALLVIKYKKKALVQ